VIDLHCHALPGIDDGPDDMQGRSPSDVPRSGADRDPRVSADPGAPGRGAQPQSLIAAITIPITTKTTTAICIQIQVGDMP
jgi:hypothetical protein